MSGPLPIRSRVFGRRAQPHVRVALTPIGRKHLADVLWPLRQQLPIELIALTDEGEQIGAPLRVNLVIKYVCKRRTEHSLSPPMRALEIYSLGVPRKRIAPVGSGGSPARVGTPFHLST